MPHTSGRIPLLLLLVVLAAPPAFAQDRVSGPKRPGVHQLTLTAHTLGATIGYARERRPDLAVGAELGIGGDLLGGVVFGGRHCTEAWGLSYEDKDGYEDKMLLEVLHLGAFLRGRRSPRFEYDVGVRASVFLHGDSSDDDPGGGVFLGVYGTPLFGWRWLKVGPRVQAGVFSEGSPEFGIYVVPITARLSFRW